MSKSSNSSSDDSNVKSEELNKKSERVMIPFFVSDELSQEVSSRPFKPHPRHKSRFSKAPNVSNPPHDQSFNSKRGFGKLFASKEVGFNGKLTSNREIGLNYKSASREVGVNGDSSKTNELVNTNNLTVSKELFLSNKSSITKDLIFSNKNGFVNEVGVSSKSSVVKEVGLNAEVSNFKSNSVFNDFVSKIKSSRFSADTCKVTKEVGINGERSITRPSGFNPSASKAPREFGIDCETSKHNRSDHQRNSWSLMKHRFNKQQFNDTHNNPVQHARIAYIDCNNVRNMRPLSSLYNKPEEHQVPAQDPNDLVGKIRREFKTSFNCEIDTVSRNVNFVDALIRNSNSFEDVVVDDSSEVKKVNKSHELKSVLTKMGILDKAQSNNDDPGFDELDNDLINHYVFPKYMTSPDPSSIPIPGSL